MRTISIAYRMVALLALSILLFAGTASGDELKVWTSGAFSEAYHELAQQYENTTQQKVVTPPGASGMPNSIQDRLERGDSLDVVIMADEDLDELIKQGKVIAGSRVDLVKSSIGVGVRAGAPKPDISSVDALKRTLLQAKSIAYSSSVSGVYVSTQLFQHLGIADQVMGKSKRIQGSVGAAIARGDAEIGFQQISELLPVSGIDYIGPLPPEVQKVSVFSAGVVAGSKAPDAARAFIEFLVSPAAAPTIRKTGMEPLTLTSQHHQASE